MPEPVYGESKKDYIARAIKYFMEMEGRPQKEAVGKAFGFWETYSKKRKKGK